MGLFQWKGSQILTRVNHYLEGNLKCESPSNILVVDTEAKFVRIQGKKYQAFRLGYAIHLMRKNGEWFQTGYELHSVVDFWKLLDRFSYGNSKVRLYVFAHNMAYDYTILKLDTYLSSRKLEIKMRVIENAFIVRAGNLMLLSSTNYYKESLEELGKIFGLSKMDKPDFENTTDEVLMPYCVRDVEVLVHILKQHIAFIKQHNLGNFKPTIAGQSFTAFRHGFMKHELLVHNYNDILEMEKQSYRGGRCEAFRIGKFEKLYYLDINSMYPFVMRNCEYPTKLVASYPIKNMSLKELKESDNFVLADCDIVLKKPFLACKREKLFFPIGKIRQCITLPEIEYILENPDVGRIVNLNRVVPYEKAKIFVDYVDYFYKIRLDAKNKAENEMAKLMLNSLYGKFGQHNSTVPEEVKDENVIKTYLGIMNQTGSFEVYSGLSEKYVLLGNTLYHITKKDGEFAKDSIPIIASTVTSYARRKLWEIMVKAGTDNVYYADTDSVFVNETGYSNLVDEIDKNKLGKLKLVKSGKVEIFGAKDYIFNDEVKLKGVKKNAKKLEENLYSQEQFVTKNKRYLDGIPDGFVRIDTVEKSISRNYDKGKVENGVVFPLNFSDF